MFASEEIKRRVVPECLSGKKTICLAITEPYAGSDVANLRCEARLTEDGKHYIVNGEKKWITNGTFADFFTVVSIYSVSRQLSMHQLLLFSSIPRPCVLVVRE